MQRRKFRREYKLKGGDPRPMPHPLLRGVRGSIEVLPVFGRPGWGISSGLKCRD